MKVDFFKSCSCVSYFFHYSDQSAQRKEESVLAYSPWQKERVAGVPGWSQCIRSKETESDECTQLAFSIFR